MLNITNLYYRDTYNGKRDETPGGRFQRYQPDDAESLSPPGTLAGAPVRTGSTND